MKIEAGGMLIACRDIYDEPVMQDGVSVRSLRLTLDSALTAEEISALSENLWTLFEDDGRIVGVRSGFNRFQGYSVSFARVQELESLQIQLEAVTRELAAKKVEAASAWEMFDSMRALMDVAEVTTEALQEAAARKMDEAAIFETEPEGASVKTPVRDVSPIEQ